MPTLTLPETATTSRVPAEALGRARLLRNTIAETAIPAKLQIERLTAPIRPRDRFQPMPRYKALEQIRDRWKELPKLGCLDSMAEFENGKLRLGEMRLTPTRLRYK